MTNDKTFKQYYRIDEVAEYYSISVSTVYRLTKQPHSNQIIFTLSVKTVR